jgi:hypothetical protein
MMGPEIVIRRNAIRYEDILREHFCFAEVPLPEGFERHIWDLPLCDTGSVDGEIRYRATQVGEPTRSRIIDALARLSLDHALLGAIRDFDFDINRMQQGEWVPMHNETGQKSPFEVILWLTPRAPYLGRHFVMEGRGVRRSIQPHNGLACLLDTTCPDIFHGVEPLLSDTEIISITGGLGRK